MSDTPEAVSLIESVTVTDPAFHAAVERERRREQSSRNIWSRYYAHRMSYDEYKYIGYLTAQVRAGSMGPERAMEAMSAYRKHHDQKAEQPT